MAVASYVGRIGWSNAADSTWGTNSFTRVNGSGDNLRKVWCPTDTGIQAGDYIFIYAIHRGAATGDDNWSINTTGASASTTPVVTDPVDSGAGSSPESQTWIIPVASGDIGNYWFLDVPTGGGEGVAMGHAYRFSDTPTYNGAGSTPDFFGRALSADNEDPITVTVTKTDPATSQVGVFVGGSGVVQSDTQTFTSVTGMTLELLESVVNNNAVNTYDYDLQWYHVETDAFSAVTFEWDRTGATGGNGATAVAWPATGAPLGASTAGWAWNQGQPYWQVVRG